LQTGALNWSYQGDWLCTTSDKVPMGSWIGSCICWKIHGLG